MRRPPSLDCAIDYRFDSFSRLLSADSARKDNCIHIELKMRHSAYQPDRFSKIGTPIFNQLCARATQVIAFGILILTWGMLTANASAKDALVSKWGRFEQTFKSSVNYENPLQQCTLKVTLVSPSGATNEIDGFWDGGKTWRVRFSPNQLGYWSYRTSCSDKSNRGLENQSGKFLCTSPIGQSRFAQHGPIQVAKDRHHFEHTDGTPFFWMADVAWNAPRLSSARDWIIYTQTRAGQNFSAVEWSVDSGAHAKNRSAFTGRDRIAIDPAYFQTLDEKIEVMNRAGLLSVIAPFWENANAPDNEFLPEEQVSLLVHYLNARWSAYDVAWLLTTAEGHRARWIRIGREVFANTRHAPVILFTGELNPGIAFQFPNDPWVDALGFGLGQNLNDDSAQGLIFGLLNRESSDRHVRPFINVLPPLENSPAPQGQSRINADDVRRVAWWSFLLTPSAGVSYGAQDVATWNSTKQSKLPAWQISLFLPGAKQLSLLQTSIQSLDWWTLRPAPQALSSQPGNEHPNRYIAHATSEARNLSFTYVPEDRTLDLFLDALPPVPEIHWLNPRTGKISSAVAVVGTRTCQIPTLDQGDWVLLMKSGK